MEDGTLACERMMDALEQIAAAQATPLSKAWVKCMDRWLARRGLHLLRHVKSKLPGSHNRPEFQRHRYPGLPIHEVAERLARFQRLLGDDRRLSVEPITATIYRIQLA
jgi:hypothetical protein